MLNFPQLKIRITSCSNEACPNISHYFCSRRKGKTTFSRDENLNRAILWLASAQRSKWLWVTHQPGNENSGGIFKLSHHRCVTWSYSNGLIAALTVDLSLRISHSTFFFSFDKITSSMLKVGEKVTLLFDAFYVGAKRYRKVKDIGRRTDSYWIIFCSRTVFLKIKGLHTFLWKFHDTNHLRLHSRCPLIHSSPDNLLWKIQHACLYSVLKIISSFTYRNTF